MIYSATRETTDGCWRKMKVLHRTWLKFIDGGPRWWVSHERIEGCYKSYGSEQTRKEVVKNCDKRSFSGPNDRHLLLLCGK